MSDFETSAAPDTGHAATLPPPESTPVEQSAPVDAFEAMMDKASAAMAGEDRPESAPQTTAPDPEPPKAEEPPAPAPERMHKLKVGGEERELSESDVLQLASMGADYTRKTQELARDRDRLAGYKALMDRMETDPAFRSHVFQFEIPPTQPAESPHPPTDPIERLKWEAVQQAKAEMMREMAPLAEQIPVIQAMQRIESTKASIRQDPAAPQVLEAMRAYVEAQPERFRAGLFQELDTNPEAFLDVYQDVKGRLVAYAAKKSATAPTSTQKPAAPAPQLESSGTPAPARTTGDENLRTLRKQVKAGTAGTDAIERLLEYSGAFKRMGA